MKYSPVRLNVSHAEIDSAKLIGFDSEDAAWLWVKKNYFCQSCKDMVAAPGITPCGKQWRILQADPSDVGGEDEPVWQIFAVK